MSKSEFSLGTTPLKMIDRSFIFIFLSGKMWGVPALTTLPHFLLSFQIVNYCEK